MKLGRKLAHEVHVGKVKCKKNARFIRDLPDAKVEDVVSFLVQVREVCHGQWYFRGHKDDKRQRLKPSIGREFSYVGRTVCFTRRQEQALLHRFRRHAYKHYDRVLTEWEALFLARHHELPVRLLDWTTNPVVALFFACTHETSDEAKDGALWAIKRREGSTCDVDVFDTSRSPLDYRGIKLVFPFYPTPRLTEQSGIFTLHEDPWAELDSLAGSVYPEDELDVDRLKKWLVPGEKKQSIIDELERLSINTRTLFPDMDGLARGLWQSEVLRNATGT
jgi:hypothetical protein